MIESIETYLQILGQISLIWLILIAFAVTFVENIFPPAPSDVILVTIAVIVGGSRTNQLAIIPVILAATSGSSLGFWVMYLFGKKFEHAIIEQKRLKFISVSSVEKVENMFRKWGFKLIAINRFMSGTRAVISFVAGMSNMPQTRTLSLATISSFSYYAILSLAGYFFGNDWKSLAMYFHIYEKVVFIVIIVIIMIVAAIWFIRKTINSRKNKIIPKE